MSYYFKTSNVKRMQDEFELCLADFVSLQEQVMLPAFIL